MHRDALSGARAKNDRRTTEEVWRNLQTHKTAFRVCLRFWSADGVSSVLNSLLLSLSREKVSKRDGGFCFALSSIKLLPIKKNFCAVFWLKNSGEYVIIYLYDFYIEMRLFLCLLISKLLRLPR